MIRILRKFLMVKIIGFLLVGHVAAQSVNVIDFAHAIGKAEGFYSKGTIPNRTHNPGDLRALSAHDYPGQVGINSKRYAIFRSDKAGWQALYIQIEKVAAGQSRFYGPDTTMRQFSKKYAEVDSPWLRNVCKMLSISPSTTMREYFDSNRIMVLAADTAPVDPPTFDFNSFEGVLQP